MKSKRWILAGAAVLAASLAFAGLAYAQTATPPAVTPGYGQGYGGMMGGRGGMLGGWAQAQGDTGALPMGPGQMGGYGRGQGGMMGGRGGMLGGATGSLHTYMLDAIAPALDLTRAELDEKLAAGQTLYEVALAQGLTQTEFVDAMQAARAEALAQAVADGGLTQAQADWMTSRMAQNGAPGNCPHLNADPAATPNN